MRTVATFVTMGVLATFLLPGVDARADPLVGDTPGVFALGDLVPQTGSGVLKSTGREVSSTWTLGFGPNLRQQGDPVWIIQRFAAQIDALPSTQGHWNVSMDLNGFTSVSLDYRIKGAETRVDSVSLLGGRQHRTEIAPAFEEREDNYVQERSFLAGQANVFRVKVEPIGPTRGGLIVKLDEHVSGLEVTQISPEEVEVGVPKTLRRVQAGEMVEIPYQIRRRGLRAPSGYTARITVPLGLVAVGGISRSHPASNSKTPTRGKFTLRATETGTYNVGLRVSSDYNSPGTVLRVAVGKQESTSRWPLGVSLLLGTVIAGLAGAIAWRAFR